MILPVGQLDLTPCSERVLIKYEPADPTQMTTVASHLPVVQTYEWPVAGAGVDSWLCRQ